MTRTVNSGMHDLATVMQGQLREQPAPPPILLEHRVCELERMGMTDIEELPGVPSSVRQFALATLRQTKVPYFITLNDDLLMHRDVLEDRYGIKILTIPEAIMLLRETDGTSD